MREYFPFFDKNKDVIYLDTAATSQTLYTVIEDLNDFMVNHKSNAHRSGHSMGTWVDQKYSLAKESIANLVGVSDPDKTVIFTSGASQGLSDAVSLVGKALPGGTFWVGIDCHHSLILPIQKLSKSNPWWTIKYIGLDNEGRLNLDELEQGIKDSKEKVNVIAVNAVSNVIGKLNDLQRIKDIAHSLAANTIIDASQLIGKRTFNASGFDFVSWSWHKAYGPMGLGTLIIDPIWLEYNPVRPGGGTVTSVGMEDARWIDTAAKFETGTQNLAAISTIPRLVDWLKKHEEDIEVHDKMIARMVNANIVPEQFTSASETDTGLISLYPNMGSVEDYIMLLDATRIYMRGGKLCAQPLVDTITANKALLRMSWGCYTQAFEIEKTFDRLGDIYGRLQRNVR